MNPSFQKLGRKNPLLFLFNAPFGCCVNVRKIETYPERKKIHLPFYDKSFKFSFFLSFLSLSQRPNSAKWWIERKKKRLKFENYQVGFLRRRRSERNDKGFPGISEAFESRSVLWIQCTFNSWVWNLKQFRHESIGNGIEQFVVTEQTLYCQKLRHWC